MARALDRRGRRSPEQVSAGPHPGSEDGEGADLLPGDRGTPTSTRPRSSATCRRSDGSGSGGRYRTDALLDEIRKILRTQGQHNIALAGAGRLGSAIASSPIFAEHGITISAIFEIDPEKVGHRVGDMVVSSTRTSPRSAATEHHRGRHHDSRRDRPGRGRCAHRSRRRIIFNYSRALLDVPADVNVHTSNPRSTCSTRSASTLT